uniref:ubiquitinyl hydrolase 1 n=1 Tax=Macrostomum lignano TaxID=282301 RepID=A0A1I8FA87_9PLAT
RPSPEPVDWLELESDPGLFTLLIEDMGVTGVQVEEIRSCRAYARGRYGLRLLCFLFKLRASCRGLDPTRRGDAILARAELARAHNRHARPSDRPLTLAHKRMHHRSIPHWSRPVPAPTPHPGSGASVIVSSPDQDDQDGCAGDTFHFVSFIPHNGSLLELDGLRAEPTNHGPFRSAWTRTFLRVIRDRVGLTPVSGSAPFATSSAGHASTLASSAAGDIMYNLMAVVPDKRLGTFIYLSWSSGSHQGEQDSEVLQIGNSQPATPQQQEPQLLTLCSNSNFWRADFTKPLTIETNPSLKMYQLREGIRHRVLRAIVRSLLLQAVAASTLSPQVQASHGSSGSGNKYSTRAAARATVQAAAAAASRRRRHTATSTTVSASTSAAASTAQLSSSITMSPSPTAGGSLRSFTESELLQLMKMVQQSLAQCRQQLAEEQEKYAKYRTDDCRRCFDYDPLIRAFLTSLTRPNLLRELVETAATAAGGG